MKSWAAALGTQPDTDDPERVILFCGFHGEEAHRKAGEEPPSPSAPRFPGEFAPPRFAAARSQAAAVLVLLDAAAACLVALQAAPGAGRVPQQPHELEVLAAQLSRQLENTGLPFGVRAAGESGEGIGASTDAGIRAIGACCSLVGRLLRLATARADAQKAESSGRHTAATWR